MFPRYVLVRTAISLAVGLAVALAVAPRFSWPVALISGWNGFAFVLLCLAWLGFATADAATTGKRAGADDPGRGAVYALVLFTSAASLLAAVFLQRQASVVAPRSEAFLAALCLATVALSWTLTHTAFTVRYAHLYYREDEEGVGGAEFPGGAPPTYMDFAYFAFTVGMCFQVSDVQVTSSQIRRGVLLHATMSFLYNTAILAFVLNLVFSLAG
jgi:uncharacterized membrane protein